MIFEKPNSNMFDLQWHFSVGIWESSLMVPPDELKTEETENIKRLGGLTGFAGIIGDFRIVLTYNKQF